MFASIGRFCYRHRRLVALTWLVAVVLGFAVGYRVFDRLGIDYRNSTLESLQGFDRIERSADYGARILAFVDAPPSDPAVETAVTDAAADLTSYAGVARVVEPTTAPLPELVAADGRGLLVAVDLEKDLSDEEFEAAVDRSEERLREIGPDSGAEVLLGGNPLLNREMNEQTQKDTETGEMIALPATFLVMIVVFGGFVAAGIPMLGAIASIAGGLAALYGISHVMELDPSVASVTTVLGLGLSIDYALLVVSRYREERGKGRDAEDAVVATMATAGRTITFSALTVAVSLSALFVFEVAVFPALGAAGVSVVLVALLAGLTLVPALLGLFGRRISVPSTAAPDDGFFARLARRVQRRPVLVAVGVSGLLLAAGTPFLHANFQNGGADLLPGEFESRQFFDVTSARFPAERTEPVLVVADATPAQLRAYGERVADLPGVAGIGEAEPRQDGWSLLEITPTGTSQGPAAQGLVQALRADRPDFRTLVSGDAAVLVDFKDAVVDGLPWAALIIGLGTFTLLFLMTGSVLVPLKALVMNTLSLGASFGLLVFVFQDGNGAGLLGFTSTGGLETWVPVVVFCFAFGLSMDYEVFLLSRVKEIHDTGVGNDRAVELGLQRSGRIITSAALLIVIVFLGFAAGRMLGIKELGTALAVAVAVDATLVRCLLVPATMTLLGEWNWWAPRPLRRLHARFGLTESVTLPAPRTQGETEPTRAILSG